ncbi:MAG: hypothetical protein HC903_08320 [Methylacidiphilales bacterium]|nr:hypothetical protein [Candidatus Methylacidiphilales bacterium]
MDIKDLPEISALEDEDYFVIQSGDLTGKILKSNLEFSTPVTPQIITSINPPENPQLGMIWNELDVDNNLIQQWNYSYCNNILKWMSQVFDFLFSETSMSQTQVYPMNTDFDYYIKSFYGFYYSSNAMPSNGILGKRLHIGNKANFVNNYVAGIGFSAKAAQISDYQNKM